MFLAALAVLLLAACAAPLGPDDRRHGQSLVCHNGEESMAVSNADYHRHIEHGDSVGPCPHDG